MPLKKYKSLSEENPILATEWNYDKNDLNPTDVSLKSNKKVWWICYRKHEWQATISHRSNGKSCPFCRYLVTNKNHSFGVLFPLLLKEWDSQKNESINPHDIFPSYPHKVWWKCDKSHEWEASVNQRTRKKSNCPYCFGSKVDKSTCLSSINPNLAKEWHPTKNGTLTPERVRYGSSKKVWWKCNKGHVWEATISVRNYSGCRCPECAKIVTLKNGVKLNSMVEAYYYLKLKSKNIEFKYNENYPNSRYKYDFYIPSENKFIEVTSFNKRGNKKWIKYLRKIVKKKNYVENVIGGKFEFIQKEIKNKDLVFVKKNII